MPGWLLIVMLAAQRVEVKSYIVTAYCPGACCCAPYADGLTASGWPALGPVVAAPPSVPFGTLVFVPAYGLASVQDRGTAIRGNRLDVLMPTHWAARQWGRRELTVCIWR